MQVYNVGALGSSSGISPIVTHRTLALRVESLQTCHIAVVFQETDIETWILIPDSYLYQYHQEVPMPFNTVYNLTFLLLKMDHADLTNRLIWAKLPVRIGFVANVDTWTHDQEPFCKASVEANDWFLSVTKLYITWSPISVRLCFIKSNVKNPTLDDDSLKYCILDRRLATQYLVSYRWMCQRGKQETSRGKGKCHRTCNLFGIPHLGGACAIVSNFQSFFAIKRGPLCTMFIIKLMAPEGCPRLQVRCILAHKEV